jgi:DNA-binding Lrp family transcriptional regulator
LILFLFEDRKQAMKMLTAQEQKIARSIQSDIPLVSHPFHSLANSCDLPEKKLIDFINKLIHDNIIRKFGAVLRHQKAGFTKNALVIWSIPDDQTEEAGKTLASFNFVSHCYERNPAFLGKYNLFSMVHTKEKDISSLINKAAESIGIRDYLIMESCQEYKKTSPEYF